MNSFEARFRRKFRPDGDGFLFKHRGVDARFSHSEYEAFVSEWRRLWANRWIWIAYLVGGVAGPAALARAGYNAGAITLAGVSALMLIVVLVYPERQPHDAAAARVPMREASKRTGGENTTLPLIFAMLILTNTDSAQAGPWYLTAWPYFVAVVIALAGFEVWRWHRGQPLPQTAERMREVLGGIGLLIVAAHISRRIDAGWFDYTIAGACVFAAAVGFYRAMRGKPVPRPA